MKRRPSNLCFQLDQTFFGYKPEDRLKLHESLFELLWWGEGRWTFDDIYHMPLQMRKLWIAKTNEKIEKRYAAVTNTTNNSGTPRKKKTKPIVKSPL